MRRTDEEFKAEVFRRSEAYRKTRKKRRKVVLTICLPVLLCSGILMALFAGGYGGSTMEAAYDNAMSVEFAQKPAAPACPEEAPAMSDNATGTVADSPAAANAMPEDFAIRFVWAIGAENVYDTYTGQIQKDLVLDGVISAEFEPDREVLEEIYRMLCDLDIASISREMTARVLTSTDEAVACTPLTTYEIRFTMNGQDYQIFGDYTASFYPEDAQAVSFMEFVQFMQGIVLETPEYQALPEANGGYD